MGVRAYTNWRSGSSGAADPAVTEYNSENAQVYEGGTLGPRPGWRKITQAGSPIFDATEDTPVGIQWFRESDDDEGLTTYFSDYNGSASHYERQTFGLSNSTWSGVSFELDDIAADFINLHPNNWDDNGHVPTWNDGFLLTALGPYIGVAGTSGPGSFTVPTITDGQPTGVTIYRERAYYWGIQNFPGRIYFSDAADYTTVQASNYFDVNVSAADFAGAVTGMFAVKNALIIVRKDDRWLVLTGTSPAQGTLRELGRDIAPDYLAAAIVDNEVYFLDRTGSGLVVATPSFVDSRTYRHLSPTAYPGSTSLRPDNSFLPQEGVGDEVTRALYLPGRVTGNDTDILAVERVNDVFNLSRWTLEDEGTLDDIFFTRARPNEMYAMQTNSSSWELFSRNHTLNRPARSNDSLSKSLGAEDGPNSAPSVTVRLGEQRAEPGHVIRPVKVILDIDYWKGGAFSSPSMSVDATVVGTESDTPEDSAAQQTVTTTSWVDTSSTIPYRRRVAVPLPNLQYGTAFYVTLTFDNIALDVVQVYYDEQRDPR